MRIFLPLIALIALAWACAKKTEDKPATTNVATAAVTNLSTVSQNLTPASLATASASTLSENACAGKAGLVDCQPEFLKIYLKVSKEQLDAVTQIVAAVGGALGELPDGASGTFEAEDGRTGEYTKTNSENYTFTILSGATKLAYIQVTGTTYLLEMDFGGLGEEGGGKYEATVAYTAADNWTMTVMHSGGACRTDDPRAPQNVRLIVGKSGALWTGKVMLYSPRWAQFSPDPTCGDTVADTTSFNMYSDFVADAVVAKMSVYVANSTRTDVASRPISAFCTEYPSLCPGGSVFIAETPASYANPACITAATGAATWNSNCSSAPGGTAVSAASYDATAWIEPATFKTSTTVVGP